MKQNTKQKSKFESFIEEIGKDVGDNFIEFDIRFDEVEDKSDILKEQYGIDGIKEWDAHFWSGFGDAIHESAKEAGREYVEWSDTVDADSMTPKEAESWVADNLYANISGSEVHMYMKVKFDEKFEQTPDDVYIISHDTWKDGFHNGVVDTLASF